MRTLDSSSTWCDFRLRDHVAKGRAKGGRSGRVRADEMVVAHGLAADTAHARSLIMAGEVMAKDPEGHEAKVEKAGDLIAIGSTLRLLSAPRDFVSRGGKKLDPALDAFGIDVRGRICADIGISTGGFTDC